MIALSYSVFLVISWCENTLKGLRIQEIWLKMNTKWSSLTSFHKMIRFVCSPIFYGGSRSQTSIVLLGFPFHFKDFEWPPICCLKCFPNFQFAFGEVILIKFTGNATLKVVPQLLESIDVCYRFRTSKYRWWY